jgi:SAM-dependent methyltransferase
MSAVIWTTSLVPARPTFAVRSAPPLTLAGWLRHDRIRRLLTLCENVTSVLEVGAGEGALAVRLASVYDYTGVEPDVLAHRKAAQRLAALGRGMVILGDVNQVDPGLRFDLVCAFEVLEHIEADKDAVRDWCERLHPGGMLLLTVPAGEHRFGAADARVGHYRRYERAGLRDVLEKGGFEVLKLDRYGFPLAYLLETLRHLIAARTEPNVGPLDSTGGGGRWFQPPDALAWATRLATVPFRAIDRMLPAGTPGTSLIALATSPSSETAQARTGRRSSRRALSTREG